MKPFASSALCSAPAGAPTAGAPKVSVLLPTYNRACFLGKTIDSIRAQTLTDWELIVVDDGSTDETPALMRRYCAKDPRIHYVRQPHFGAPARALNLGLRLARGQYLHKQDDDDVAYADKFIKCAAALDEQADCDAVWVRWRVYRGKSTRGWRLSTIGHFIPLFFRMETVRRQGGWNEFYKLFEDMPLFWRIKESRGGSAFLGDILYDYRKSANDDARHHRGLIAVWRLYQTAERAMRPLYRRGLPDMVQPHWGVRHALKQIYFVRRHAFLPSICYAHWQQGTRAALNQPWRRRRKWESMLQAAPAHFSWMVLWRVQAQLWRKARHNCLPLRWRVRNARSLARYYFASRRQARMSKSRQAKKP